MEVQMAAQAAAKSAGRSTPPHHHHGGGGAKPVPGYLRPSAGSCHHVCKYEDKEKEATKSNKKKDQSKPRKQPAAAAPGESQSRVMGKVRSVFRRRVGDSSKAAAGKPKGGGDGVEWKDIVAYDTTTTVLPRHGSSPEKPEKVSAPAAGSGDAGKKDVVKGNGEETQDEALDKKIAKPPIGKKPMAGSLPVDKMSIIDQELLHHGYQTLSPSLIQSRASLLRDLEKEMVGHEAPNPNEAKPMRSLDDVEEEGYAAAAEASRPIPAHRRAKSMISVSLSSSRSVRYPFIGRQASRNSSAAAGSSFKLRSRSTKAPIMAAPPPEEEEERKPARMRSRMGGEDPSTGRGIQLRIRSLRRRGVGGGGAGAGGFVVPAVALRHQKTLEKKKSRRLYNNVIEETASKLVKTRKSRVKALVGAFESVISKIAK